MGLILLGSCPGGAASNFWTDIFGGDVNLSVTMTLVSTAASFGMTSFWAWLLGRHLVSGEGSRDPTMSVQIPYHMIAITLLVLVIPLGLGILFSHKWPAKAARIHQLIAKKFFIAYLVGLFVVAIYSFQYTFWLITWRHVLTGFLMGTLGYVFGAGLAIVCLQKRAQIIAISLETALQNGAIALVVMNVTFVSPYAEIGLLPIAGYVICSTTLMLLPLYILSVCCKCCTGQAYSSQKHEGIQIKSISPKKSEARKLKEASSLMLEQTELTDNEDEAKLKNVT